MEARGRSDEDDISQKSRSERLLSDGAILWSDRRSGSGGGGKAVVFDVLKSRWR